MLTYVKVEGLCEQYWYWWQVRVWLSHTLHSWRKLTKTTTPQTFKREGCDHSMDGTWKVFSRKTLLRTELQEIPVAIREQSGVLCFHSRWMPVSPGASGMQPRDPCRPWRKWHEASQVAWLEKNLPANAGDISDEASIPGSGRSPREGK